MTKSLLTNDTNKKFDCKNNFNFKNLKIFNLKKNKFKFDEYYLIDRSVILIKYFLDSEL